MSFTTACATRTRFKDQAGLWVVPGEHATRILFDWPASRSFLINVTYALLLRVIILNNNIKILLVSFVHHIELQNFLNAPRTLSASEGKIMDGAPSAWSASRTALLADRTGIISICPYVRLRLNDSKSVWTSEWEVPTRNTNTMLQLSTHIIHWPYSSLYTVFQKKEATLIFDITSPSVEIFFLQFLKHFVHK